MHENAPLRLAVVAPLHESVPPRAYGGTERVVSYLTEQLVELGHDVTLFASGDSQTAAKLVATTPRAVRFSKSEDALALHYVSFEDLYRRARDFDLVHFHVDYVHFAGTRRERITHLSTLHGRLDLPGLPALYREFADMPLVSISNAHRAPLPWIAWHGTVYHGLPNDLYHLETSPAGYMAFLGRVAPEKRLDRAIEIAGRAGVRLMVAAKIDRADHDYYVEVIKPLLAQRHVEFLGEIAQSEKQAFLGGASALLFPIEWPEPFGMVMIEALACGTPVIAFRRGSVPEIIENGVTGFICDDIDEALHAVERLPEVARATCRSEFERRFTAARMAGDYIDIYRRLIDAGGDHQDRRPVLHPGNEHADRGSSSRHQG